MSQITMFREEEIHSACKCTFCNWNWNWNTWRNTCPPLKLRQDPERWEAKIWEKLYKLRACPGVPRIPKYHLLASRPPHLCCRRELNLVKPVTLCLSLPQYFFQIHRSHPFAVLRSVPLLNPCKTSRKTLRWYWDPSCENQKGETVMLWS